MLLPPKPLNLRPLEVDDIPAVLAIDKLSFPTPRKEILYRYEIAQNSLAHYQALTRIDEAGKERLLGYAGYWTIAGEIHISTIAVDPPYREQGLGQLLLLNILFLAYKHEADLVTLEVRENNHAARELYRKYRFSEVGMRRGYYRDTGENAVLMTVVLETDPGFRAFLQRKREELFHNPALITF